jgi:type II secretory pathway predicted ATPase ExeA/TPR repeat protein
VTVARIDWTAVTGRHGTETFRGPTHRNPTSILASAIEGGASVAVLTGAAETGKTTVLREVGVRLRSGGANVIDIGTSPCDRLTPRRLTEKIVAGLGAGHSPGDAARLIQLLTQAREVGDKLVLLIDAAELLSREAIEYLGLLSSLRSLGTPLLHLVLSGRPEFWDGIKTGGLTNPERQAPAHAVLAAMPDGEARDYIVFRLNLMQQEATPYALSEIVRLGKGLPGRIDRLLDGSVALAAALGYKRLTSQVAGNAAAALALRAGSDDCGARTRQSVPSPMGRESLPVFPLPPTTLPMLPAPRTAVGRPTTLVCLAASVVIVAGAVNFGVSLVPGQPEPTNPDRRVISDERGSMPVAGADNVRLAAALVAQPAQADSTPGPLGSIDERASPTGADAEPLPARSDPAVSPETPEPSAQVIVPAPSLSVASEPGSASAKSSAGAGGESGVRAETLGVQQQRSGATSVEDLPPPAAEPAARQTGPSAEGTAGDAPAPSPEPSRAEAGSPQRDRSVSDQASPPPGSAVQPSDAAPVYVGPDFPAGARSPQRNRSVSDQASPPAAAQATEPALVLPGNAAPVSPDARSAAQAAVPESSRNANPQAEAPPVPVSPGAGGIATAGRASPPPSSPTAPAPRSATAPPKEQAVVMPPGGTTSALLSSLLRLGDVKLSVGDISAARLLFTRAAGAGSAEAATKMGKTYDPAFLSEIGAIGIAPDIAAAKTWYGRAASLGDAEAAERLKRLGTTTAGQ